MKTTRKNSSKDNKVTLIFYHSADVDGKTCAAIAHKKFGDDPTYIGYNYQDIDADKIIEKFPNFKIIYLLDCSFPVREMERLLKYGYYVIVIDHHVSIYKDYRELERKFENFTYYYPAIPHMSAALLTWSTLFPKIAAPDIVRLVSVYDTWDTEDPQWEVAKTINASLSFKKIADYLPYLEENNQLLILIDEGVKLKFAQELLNNKNAFTYGGTLYWEELCFFALNASGNSLVAGDGPIAGKHEAILLYKYKPAEGWKVSLYQDTKHLGVSPDLAPIAVKYGGGGHAGACGFTCKELPFRLDDIRAIPSTFTQAIQELIR